MKPLISQFSNRRRVAAIALLAGASFAGLSAPADAALHLAFGVDSLTSSNSFKQIRVRDLHGDHYHNFTQNNGAAGSHVPGSLSAIAGSGFATIHLAAMEISPFPQSRYSTGLTPSGDFHLELLGVTGAGAAENLIVRFWHDDHTHTMSVGGNAEHLSLSEINRIDFAFADGAALGTYSAQFGIVDEAGHYAGSPAFTINVNAIPEPSTALLGAAAVMVGLVRRKRR